MNPAFRPVTATDDALLLRIYASTRADEMTLTDWDAAECDAFLRMQFEAQRTHYRSHWPAAQHVVIMVHMGEQTHDVGRLWVDHGADVLHVLDITVLPDWRGLGIGEHCLRRLMDEAAAAGSALSIHVESGNPARSLYDRLGFQPVGAAQGVHQHMVWRPSLIPTLETCDEQA